MVQAQVYMYRAAAGHKHPGIFGHVVGALEELHLPRKWSALIAGGFMITHQGRSSPFHVPGLHVFLPKRLPCCLQVVPCTITPPYKSISQCARSRQQQRWRRDSGDGEHLRPVTSRPRHVPSALSPLAILDVPTIQKPINFFFFSFFFFFLGKIFF